MKETQARQTSPLVSVVIPTYNAANYISDAVKSVVHQTYPEWELIIVDDGSTDNTSEAVDSLLGDSRIRYCRQMNAGPASARNKGISMASGSLIAFLDADDYWLPQKLDRQVDVFLEFPDVDLCGGQIIIVDVDRHVVSNVPHPPKGCHGSGLPQVLYGSLVNMTTGVFRRELFERHGLFDSDCRLAEDYELILRLARDSVFYVVPEVLAHVRKGNNTDCISYRWGQERRDYTLNVIIPRFLEEYEGRRYVTREDIRRLKSRSFRLRAEETVNLQGAAYWYVRALWYDPKSWVTWKNLAGRCFPVRLRGSPKERQ